MSLTDGLFYFNGPSVLFSSLSLLHRNREAEYGEKGSQRPDEIKFTEEGIDIREVKNWSNADALARNIEKQSADRYEMFGEDIHDLTYIVSPKFTLEECDKLNETCQNSGADIEFKYH